MVTTKQTIRCFLLMISINFALLTQAEGQFLSPSCFVISPDSKTLYISLAGTGQIAVFNVEQKKITQTIDVSLPVAGLILQSEGKILLAAGCGPAGQIAMINTADMTISGRIPAGPYPAALAVNPAGDKLFICNRYSNSLAVIALADGNVLATIPLLRQPCAVEFTPDGRFVVVANFLPAGPSSGDYTAASVSIIDAAALQVVKHIQLPNGSNSLEDIVIDGEGNFAYATHILARYQMPTTQLDRGWMNTNAMSIIDLKTMELLTTVLLDDVDLGAANPWGIALSGDGKQILIAISGNHELMVIDRAGLHDRINRAAKGEKVTSVSSSLDMVPNDLSFLVDLKKRIALKGLGPRQLVVAGNQVFIAEYFSDSVSRVELGAENIQAVSLPLGEKREMTAERKGELFFNDSSLCFQKWQSCASCHPDEGRVDGLNWDLLNDGLGNPKNTRSMLLAHVTPPAMSLGVRDSAEVAVRAGIKFIQFAVRPEEDAAAIDSYLKALKPLPSPRLVDGQLSAAARNGQLVFEKAGCAVCHSGPYYTNLKSYNVGTGKGREADKPLDTSTLVELWRTAPYLHDGSVATIEEVLKQANPDNKHGNTSNLSETELRDLTEYLLSL